MRQNLQLANLLGIIAIFALLFTFIPYEAYQLVTRCLAIIIFILVLLVTPKLFTNKYNNLYSIIADFSERTLKKSRLLGGKKDKYHIDIVGIFCIVIFLMTLSFMSSGIYQSILAGIFTSALTAMFVYILQFKQEKKKFVYNTYSMLFDILACSKSISNSIPNIKLALLRTNFESFDQLFYRSYLIDVDGLFNNTQRLHQYITKWLSISYEYEDLSTLAVTAKCHICQSNMQQGKFKKFILDANDYMVTQFHKNMLLIYSSLQKYIDDIEKTTNFNISGRDIVTIYLEKELLKKDIGTDNKEELEIKEHELTEQLDSFAEAINHLENIHLQNRQNLHDLMDDFCILSNMSERWSAWKNHPLVS